MWAGPGGRSAPGATWLMQAKSRRCARSPESFSATKTALSPTLATRSNTSRLEGINNKIKAIKRQAYGFRDDRYFIPEKAEISFPRRFAPTVTMNPKSNE